MKKTRTKFPKPDWRAVGVTMAVTLLLHTGSPLLAQPVVPPDSKWAGKVENSANVALARTAANLSGTLQAGDTLTWRARAGTKWGGIQLQLWDAQNKSVSLTVRSQALKVYTGFNKDFTDCFLGISSAGLGGRYFARPNLFFYTDARREEIWKNWDRLPAASEHLFTIQLRRVGEELQVWIEDQFLGILPALTDWTRYNIRLSEGSALRELSVANQNWQARSGQVVLPVAAHARPNNMADARVTLKPDAALPAALTAIAPEANIDLEGLGRLWARTDDLQSMEWRRTAMDSLPEVRLFSVPQAVYSHVDVLCAAEEDPAKSPAFTVRLTRYGASRGDGVADTVVKLPAAGTDNEWARRVGQVTYGPDKKTVPLWLVKVPLRNGDIQDILTTDTSKSASMGTSKYLDVEFLDPLQGVEETQQFPPRHDSLDRIYTPGGTTPYKWRLVTDPVTKKQVRPGDERSSVHVFGAVLQESPASLVVGSNPRTLAFYAVENPQYLATVTARAAGTYTVQWDIADVDGKIIGGGKKLLHLAAGAQETVPVPVTQGLGWYAARFRLLAGQDQLLIEHPSSFVVLPPDTRKAGFESPHGTWWFNYGHGAPPDLETMGPLFLRAGLRHTTLLASQPESDTAKYKLTNWGVNWFNPFQPALEGKTLEEKLAKHEEHIRKHLALWPSTDKIIIWHESSSRGAPFPAEIRGQSPAKMSEADDAFWKVRMEYHLGLAKMVREKFPGLKMQYGNSGNSLAMVGELMRRKFPREYIDSIASEDLGQAIAPEKPTTDALQMAGSCARRRANWAMAMCPSRPPTSGSIAAHLHWASKSRPNGTPVTPYTLAPTATIPSHWELSQTRPLATSTPSGERVDSPTATPCCNRVPPTPPSPPTPW